MKAGPRKWTTRGHQHNDIQDLHLPESFQMFGRIWPIVAVAPCGLQYIFAEATRIIQLKGKTGTIMQIKIDFLVLAGWVRNGNAWMGPSQKFPHKENILRFQSEQGWKEAGLSMHKQIWGGCGQQPRHIWTHWYCLDYLLYLVVYRLPATLNFVQTVFNN